ncbi:MAG: hypothetical protein E7559_06890 [Ruminococcaceae bacterium]|nr:hypothetical protein [Oscillospiraceae bacterium]
MGVLPYKVHYENSRGETVRLDEPPLLLKEGELFNVRWRLSTARRPMGEGERLLYGRRQCEERTVTVAVAAGSTEQLAAVLERLNAVMEYDLHSGRAGRLWVGEQYLSCWCTASTKKLSCDFPSIAEVQLKLYPESPAWCTERVYRFTTGGSEEVSGHKYPCGYPRRYGTGNRELVMNNRSVAPAPMRIVFYGAAVNPRLLAGGSDIGINISLDEGEYAVIDQLAREVYMVDRAGVRTNCFDKRRKNGMTFNNVPSGSSTVQVVSGGRVDITLVEQRSEPRWTTA